MELDIRELAPADRAGFQRRVRALENGVSYPLGDDRFEIDHGDDYFAFFDRLGELSFFVATAHDEVVGSLAVILREVPGAGGAREGPAWYACDLKVRADHRGGDVAARLFETALSRKRSECSRCYAISMNPGDRSTNRVARMLARVPSVPLAFATALHLYSLDAAGMRAARPLVEGRRGPVSFLSLRGKKDIVLASTGAPLALLHAQFGPRGAPGDSEPANGAAHMFCTPAADALDSELRDHGFVPSATASVLQYGLDGQDWSFVLTSDI